MGIVSVSETDSQRFAVIRICVCQCMPDIYVYSIHYIPVYCTHIYMMCIINTYEIYV